MPSSNLPFSPGDRVVAYLRDSGGDEQDLSTQQQELQLQEWCSANSLVLSHLYIDAARQGSSTEKRDQFQEMISHFHEPGCPDKGVIVWSMSRFARNELDASYYKADLRRRKFVVFSITENIPDTPEGRLIEHVFDFANEKTLEKSSEDIRRGLGHNFQQYGAVPGTPPFGFKIQQKVVGVRRDNTPHTVNVWVIDPDQAPIVLAAFKMRSDGFGINDINGKYKIFANRTSYTTFFKNMLYIGQMKYGGITRSDYVEPIVPREIWDKVQSINEANHKENSPTKHGDSPNNPRRSGGNFMLSGIAFCNRCGSILRGQVVQFKGDRNFNYYICTGHTQNMDCDAPRIPQQALETCVIESVTDYIQDPNMLSLREENHSISAEAIKDELRARIKKEQKSLADNQRRLANLNNCIADDPNAPASTMQLIRDLEIETRNEQENIDRLKSRLDSPNVRARTSAEIKELSDKLLQLVTSNDPSERRTIIRLLIDRVDAERIENRIRATAYYYDDAVPTEALPPDPKVFMPT